MEELLEKIGNSLKAIKEEISKLGEVNTKEQMGEAMISMTLRVMEAEQALEKAKVDAGKENEPKEHNAGH